MHGIHGKNLELQGKDSDVSVTATSTSLGYVPPASLQTSLNVDVCV